MGEEVYTASKADLVRLFQKWINDRNEGLTAAEDSNDGAELAESFIDRLKAIQKD
jgi:hypothetical protein